MPNRARQAVVEMDILPQGDVYALTDTPTLVDQLVNKLSVAIIEGHFKSGERLIEADIQKKFKVSRTPIREAMRALEQIGLVTRIPRKGCIVRHITRRYIEESFPIRAALEELAARLAAKHITPEDIKKFAEILAEMEDAALLDDKGRYIKAHVRFHDLLISRSENSSLIFILDNLRKSAIWYRLSNIWHSNNLMKAVLVHKEILSLLVKNDEDALAALVKDHIMEGLQGAIATFLATSHGVASEKD